jgi:hypothetical protein
MTKVRTILILLTLIIVGTLGILASFYARGYRFDKKTFRFVPRGILVAKSDPDGAQIYINGSLKTVTNNSISLAPGTYDVDIKKEGFLPWYKRITIEKEIVTEANANLFKITPSLSAVTLSGIVKPVISSDFTKIVYGVPVTEETKSDSIGLWIMETYNLPIGFTRDPRRITDGDITDASWQFSPDGRQILLVTKTGVFLLDVNTFTPQAQKVNVASRKDQILATWETERKTKLAAQTRNLPEELSDILIRKTKEIAFSPDETKILYTASSSAILKENITKALPGSSTQNQQRNIKEGQTYVYDIKEDRNFLIDENGNSLMLDGLSSSTQGTRRLVWFPTSRNLVLAEEGKITIMDYDGTNRQTVFSGSYISPHAYPFVNTSRLLILTNLGATSNLPNIYSLSLK